MKILFAIDAFFSHSNGTSISAQRYAEMLRRFGHEVRVITNADHCTDPNIYAVKELNNPLNPMLHANGYQFAKPDNKVIAEALGWCDVVHVVTPFFLGCRVKKMALEMHKPITAAFHVQAENISSAFHLGKVELVNRALYRLHDNTMYKDVRFVHCPSQLMADELKHYGFGNELRVISNGISDDFTYFRPALSGKEARYVITMVGRLSPEKRQDLVIKAVLKSKYKNLIQLHFAGTGTVEKYYRRLGKRLPNEPIFGYYNREELLDVLHHTHLYVHASDMESEAIGCIEAFATGLVPIISNSSLSATKQFALCEESLFEVGNPDSLAARIDWWIEHPEERVKMEGVYARAAENYRLTSCVHKFEKMLVDAIRYYTVVWGKPRAEMAV